MKRFLAVPLLAMALLAACMPRSAAEMGRMPVAELEDPAMHPATGLANEHFALSRIGYRVRLEVFIRPAGQMEFDALCGFLRGAPSMVKDTVFLSLPTGGRTQDIVALDYAPGFRRPDEGHKLGELRQLLADPVYLRGGRFRYELRLEFVAPPANEAILPPPADFVIGCEPSLSASLGQRNTAA